MKCLCTKISKQMLSSWFTVPIYTVMFHFQFRVKLPNVLQPCLDGGSSGDDGDDGVYLFLCLNIEKCRLGLSSRTSRLSIQPITPQEQRRLRSHLPYTSIFFTTLPILSHAKLVYPFSTYLRQRTPPPLSADLALFNPSIRRLGSFVHGNKYHCLHDC